MNKREHKYCNLCPKYNEYTKQGWICNLTVKKCEDLGMAEEYKKFIKRRLIMNKQELIEQQNKLQKELDKLKEIIEKTPDDEYKRPRAEYGKNYYWLDSANDIQKSPEQNFKTDQLRYNGGNYYLSEEYCKNIARCKITKQRLKDLALRLNKGVEIDWENEQQNKYVIYYDYGEKMCFLNWQQLTRTQGAVYCLDEDFLKIAKQEIGEQALIELAQSGI